MNRARPGEAQVQKGENIDVRITKVSDGDTVVAEHPKGGTFRIRLYSIDAPETSQPLGDESTDYMKKLVSGKHKLEVINTDRYGRAVCVIYTKDGRSTLNYEMVEAGMAYVYDDFGALPGIHEAEKSAKQSKRGVWGKSAAHKGLRPWEYRRELREKSSSEVRAGVVGVWMFATAVMICALSAAWVFDSGAWRFWKVAVEFVALLLDVGSFGKYIGWLAIGAVSVGIALIPISALYAALLAFRAKRAPRRGLRAVRQRRVRKIGLAASVAGAVAAIITGGFIGLVSLFVSTYDAAEPLGEETMALAWNAAVGFPDADTLVLDVLPTPPLWWAVVGFAQAYFAFCVLLLVTRHFVSARLFVLLVNVLALPVFATVRVLGGVFFSKLVLWLLLAAVFIASLFYIVRTVLGMI